MKNQITSLQKIRNIFNGKYFNKASRLCVAIACLCILILGISRTNSETVSFAVGNEKIAVHSNLVRKENGEVSYSILYPQIQTEKRDKRERLINKYIYNYVQELILNKKNENIEILQVYYNVFHTDTAISFVFYINDSIDVLSFAYPKKYVYTHDNYVLPSFSYEQKTEFSYRLRDILLTDKYTDNEKSSIIIGTSAANLKNIIPTEEGPLFLFEKGSLYKKQDEVVEVLLPLQ